MESCRTSSEPQEAAVTDGTIIERNVSIDNVTNQVYIGHGSFGRVCKCRFHDTDVAIKLFERETDIEIFRRESDQLLRVKHPNIVRLIGVSADNTKPVFLLLELMENGSLYDRLHINQCVMDVKLHVLNWLTQCAEAVSYIHTLRPSIMMHRDLNTRNLLLSHSWRVLKIADFGTATAIDKTTFTNCTGTAAYMAPEVFRAKRYTEKCDVYSFAIIMWEMLSRERPFADMVRESLTLMYNVAEFELRPSVDETWPEPLTTLMTQCWDNDPTERPTMQSVLETLKDFAKRQLDEATQDNKPALQVLKVETNRDDVEEAERLINLASVCSAQGKFEEAELHNKRALSIFEMQLGPDDVRVANTLYNLAFLCNERRNFEQAERYFQRTLLIRENKLGKDNVKVAETLRNIAFTCTEQGKLEEAEQYFQRVLHIREGLGTVLK